MWPGSDDWRSPSLPIVDAEKKMADKEMEIHLMSVLVPVDGNDDENQTWAKVYQAWSEECDRLGFPSKAQFYREKARLYHMCARIHEFDPLGR